MYKRQNNERAFISMNTQNIVRLEVDDGNGIQVIDVYKRQAFINPDDCTNIRTTAKELKIPERKFVQFLLREKYLFRSP